jgi:hypothetical protein
MRRGISLYVIEIFYYQRKKYVYLNIGINLKISSDETQAATIKYFTN